MKTLARGIIFVSFAAAGVLLLIQPLQDLVETGVLDEVKLVADTMASFAMIFIGVEASERLKERWKE